MKKVFALVSIAVLALGLVGCGTSDCDSEDIAEQALDIILKKANITAKELGAYTANITCVDKKQNICSADIGTKAYDNILKELQSEAIKSHMARVVSENGEIRSALYLTNTLLEELLESEVLKIMGVENKLIVEDKGENYLSKDGKKLDITKLKSSDMVKMAMLKELINTLSQSTLNYKVVSEDKGEMIYAELNEGSEYYAKMGEATSALLAMDSFKISGNLEEKATPQEPSPSVNLPEKSQNAVQDEISPNQQETQNTALNQNLEQNSTQIQSQAESTKEPEIQPQPQNETQSVNFEQKFGTRIYLDTKDLYVNLRENPSGKVLTPIYKKDFADIKVYSFDAGKNAKWLRVTYFPAGVSDEKDAITGYIHTSQIAK